jgi:hypothetical protein
MGAETTTEIFVELDVPMQLDAPTTLAVYRDTLALEEGFAV